MVEQYFIWDIKATTVEGSLHCKLTPFSSLISTALSLLQASFIQLKKKTSCEDQSILNALVLQIWYMFSPTSIQLALPPAFLFIILDLSLSSLSCTDKKVAPSSPPTIRFWNAATPASVKLYLQTSSKSVTQAE